MLAISLSARLECRVLRHVGPWSDSRTVNINRICEELGRSVSQALIGLHCFTGCDSVSAFKGKEKIKLVKLVRDHTEFQELFQSNGQEWDLQQIDLQLIEKIVCKLYGKASLNSVNAARYEIFQIKFKTDTALPANRDALVCHTKRANYQETIHRRSLLRSSMPLFLQLQGGVITMAVSALSGIPCLLPQKF